MGVIGAEAWYGGHCDKGHMLKQVLANCPFCGELMRHNNPGFIATTWRCYNHAIELDEFDFSRYKGRLRKLVQPFISFYLGEEVRVRGELKRVPNSGSWCECRKENLSECNARTAE